MVAWPQGSTERVLFVCKWGRVFGLHPNTKDCRPRSFKQAPELDSLGAGCLPAMRTHPSRLESRRFSGFYGSLECLKNISDIQYQTG